MKLTIPKQNKNKQILNINLMIQIQLASIITNHKNYHRKNKIKHKECQPKNYHNKSYHLKIY